MSIILLLLTINLGCGRMSGRARVIVLQPMGSFSPALVKRVYKEIKKVNPNTLLRASLPLPASAYYEPRNRYRADTIIRILGTYSSGDTVIIGLTDKDISTTNGNITDWGVMGLGYCPGNACIVSTFRLSKSDLFDQFYKVAIHELGHTQGLPHCQNKTCFMRDAEGGNPVNEEIGFCASCTANLVNRGWKFQVK